MFLCFSIFIRDVDLAGFQIPAHSHIVPLINAVHMDKTLWNPNNMPELDPNQFNPSRFINEDGKVWKPEYFLPFGVGRRKFLFNFHAYFHLIIIIIIQYRNVFGRLSSKNGTIFVLLSSNAYILS